MSEKYEKRRFFSLFHRFSSRLAAGGKRAREDENHMKKIASAKFWHKNAFRHSRNEQDGKMEIV